LKYPYPGKSYQGKLWNSESDAWSSSGSDWSRCVADPIDAETTGVAKVSSGFIAAIGKVTLEEDETAGAAAKRPRPGNYAAF